jgi:hypothetical protein
MPLEWYLLGQFIRPRIFLPGAPLVGGFYVVFVEYRHPLFPQFCQFLNPAPFVNQVAYQGVAVKYETSAFVRQSRGKDQCFRSSHRIPEMSTIYPQGSREECRRAAISRPCQCVLRNRIHPRRCVELRLLRWTVLVGLCPAICECVF